MLPTEWYDLTLGDLVTKSAFGPRFSSDLYLPNGSIGTIRTTDLSAFGKINYSTIPYADLKIKEYQEHLLESGDLLITRSGTCGIPCIFKKQPKPIIAGAFLIRFQLNSKVNGTFLHELLNFTKTQSDIKRLAAGGVQKNLTGTSLKKLKLLIPPLPEQQKIAKILSTWDKAISTTEKLIETSKQQKKSLMQQLLTGKKRLLSLETGKVFEGEWEEVTIASTSKCFSGGTPSRSKEEYYGGNIPWITSGKLNDRFVTSVNEYITESGLKHSSAKVVKNGSLLIAMYGATAGKVAINKLTGATVNQAVLALEVDIHCHNFFLFYLFEVEMVKALNLVQGGQPNLNAAIIKAIKIKLPQLIEQKKIASVLTSADKEIELLQTKLAHFKQEKKALMQQLLTGKRRVRGLNGKP